VEILPSILYFLPSMYREHIFVCLNERPASDPQGDCCQRGARELFDGLKVATRGHKDIRINRAGCLGRCAEGPVIVRYPAGEWLAPADKTKCEKLVKDILS